MLYQLSAPNCFGTFSSISNKLNYPNLLIFSWLHFTYLMWYVNSPCIKDWGRKKVVNAAVKHFCVYYLFLYIFYSLLSKIIIVGLKPLKIFFQANISMKIFVIKFCNPKKQLPLSLKTTSTQIIVSRNLKLLWQFKVAEGLSWSF